MDKQKIQNGFYDGCCLSILIFTSTQYLGKVILQIPKCVINIYVKQWWPNVKYFKCMEKKERLFGTNLLLFEMLLYMGEWFYDYGVKLPPLHDIYLFICSLFNQESVSGSSDPRGDPTVNVLVTGETGASGRILHWSKQSLTQDLT